MAIKSNLTQMIEKLERLKAAVQTGPDNQIPPDFSDAVFSAVNAGMGLMKQRIFNRGEDMEDVTLGEYVGAKTRLTKAKYSSAQDGADQFDERMRRSQHRAVKRAVKADADAKLTAYQKYRLSRGRQIDYKDLEMEGSLRRAIICATEQGRVIIGIEDEESAKIAGYQEKQIGNIRAGQNANTGTAQPAKIFGLSESEFEHVEKEGQAAINQVIKLMLNDL